MAVFLVTDTDLAVPAGQAAGSVPKTPPPPPRPPLGNLTNVCATPDSCGPSERRRHGERRRSETLADDTPPTPMTNLKLLTNIAASQQAGTRKTLFAGDAAAPGRERAPPEAAAVSRRVEPPVTPRGDENARPPHLSAEAPRTPVQHQHSVFDTPVSGDASRAKVRWRRRASDVLPLSASGRTEPPPPLAAAFTVARSRKDKSLSVLCFR